MMIPISVQDILKILDQVPIWKAIVGMPKRIAELEQKVAALEGKMQLPPPKPLDPARICPICESPMKVIAEKDHRTFGIMGLKVHEMECQSCGNKASREFDPSKGYS